MKSEFSAGGAVFRKRLSRTGPTGIEWLICRHSGYHKWVLPKGIVEPNETPEAAAVREVQEECGITARILHTIPGRERYTYSLGHDHIRKEVQYYLMEYVSGDIGDHNWEMEDVAWLPYESALGKLEYSGAKRILRSAYCLLQEQKPEK